MNSDQKPGSYVLVEPGVELYYEERGTGTPIIFIPGWTFTTEFFRSQLDHFSKDYRAIAIDPRSQGRSTKTVLGNDYATHGADLARLIRALDLHDVVLVGWSFGCLQSWAYIRQAGLDNVRAVVSVDLSPKPLCTDPNDWSEGPLDEIAGAYTTYLTSPQGQRDFVSYYATEVMVQRELTAAELFWILDQSQKTPHYIAASLFAAGMFSNYLDEARLVDQNRPALNIVAEHWAETARNFLYQHCRSTPLEVLGGHMMFWEHADRFNEILEGFLKGLD